MRGTGGMRARAGRPALAVGMPLAVTMAFAVAMAFAVPALVPTAQAQPAPASDEALFVLGVVAYEQGRLGEAEQSFRELLERGHHHPAVLFNLGNSAYRQGRFAVAAWAYEWARRLAPTDEAIAENLALARARLVVDELPSSLSPTARAALDLLRTQDIEHLALAFLATWCAGWLLLSLRVLLGGTWATAPALVLLLLSAVLALPLSVRAAQASGPPEGLVIAPAVVVRSGPADSYAALFELHAGTLLQELESRSGWVRVRVPHGPGGWLPQSALAIFGRPESLPPRRP